MTAVAATKRLHAILGVYSIDDDESLAYVKSERDKAVFAIKIDCSTSLERFSCR